MSPSHHQNSFESNDLINATTNSTTTKPPRPMNCFLLYRHEKQKEILAQCPGANHRDISKIIAKWWRQATAEEKEPYVKKAALEKIKHAHRYPAYKFMPQKKSKNGTRTYKRRTQDEFTSKSKELNYCMKLMYHAGDATATPSPNVSMPVDSTDAATTTTTDTNPASLPALSAKLVPSAMLLPMNNPASYIDKPSPSSSSLSLSSTSSPPTSLASPYYHPYADIYYQQDSMTASSFLLKDSAPLDCLYYSTDVSQGIENNSTNGHFQLDMNTFTLNHSYNDDSATLYAPGDYFYQPPRPQQQSSLFGTTTPSPCASIYSNYTTAYPDAQDYQQHYLKRPLSPAEFYINPSLTCEDLAFATTCSPNSLL